MSRLPRERYAGFGTRLGAALLDSLLVIVVMLLFSVALTGIGIDVERLGQGMHTMLIDILFMLITILFWIRLQATPGKLLAGCRIVTATDHQPPGPLRCVLRYIAYLVSILPLGLGFLWILRDSRRQGFHDKIAGTVVLIEDDAFTPLAQLAGEF